MSTPPQRILLLRPDTYGDLFLFEPVPRLLRDAWPQAEIAVLVRQSYADAVPLLLWDGVRVLTTNCEPYREGPGENPKALAKLREDVLEFAPDCLVAACFEQTWLEALVASFVPTARQVSLGKGITDPLARAPFEAVLPVDWSAIYPEKVPVEADLGEFEKNLALASTLLGHEVSRWWPMARVPGHAAEQVGEILAEMGLTPGNFVVCAAAGVANVRIKSWPAASYSETLAWLERERNVRALLIGHETERELLESVRQSAREHGADPALWLGQDGEMPLVAGLLAAARFYFGNDTGAVHLAASLGRPVVSIFGGGHWPRFAPTAHRALTIVQPLPCFGCAWDCYFADAPCVRTITPASVQQAMGQFLDAECEGSAIHETVGMDAGARALIEQAAPRLRFLRQDSVDRLRQINTLTAQLHTSESDRDERQVQIEKLTEWLRTSEEDRVARLVHMETLTEQLEVSEADRAARLVHMETLTELLKASEAERALLARQIETHSPVAGPPGAPVKIIAV